MSEPESKKDESSTPNSTTSSPSIRTTAYSSKTTTITDNLSDTMEGLDSLIAKRKAELAERLKSGDKALINVK